MKQLSFLYLSLLLLVSCQAPMPSPNEVSTTDIDLFWLAYDSVMLETDTVKQREIIQRLYIDKGTIGLTQLIAVRNYSAEEYVQLINRYPKYWNSLRENTLKAKNLAGALHEGIAKFKALYPNNQPASIYFTVGAMRSNGTTKDSLVLIGSELAMADTSTDISEFEGDTKDWLAGFFGGNPIDQLVLLNVHEYVHTQQHTPNNELLQQVLHEGIAEFISTLSMGVPSASPAIAYGKKNPAVREKFEQEMFYNNTYEWLWSNAENDFNTRDLGYYIGYEIAALHYEKASNKTEAIRQLIELDYQDEVAVFDLVNQTHFFSKPLSELKENFELIQPKVLYSGPFMNGSQDVSTDEFSLHLAPYPNSGQDIVIPLSYLLIVFSEPMSANRNFEFGPLGEEAVVPFKRDLGWSNDDTKYAFEMDSLAPNKHYQIVVGSGFRNKAGVPIKPYLIEFKTAAE